MRRTGTLAAVLAAALIAGVGAAQADQTMHYRGLILRDSTKHPLAEIDTSTSSNNLFQKKNKDAKGDRMHVKAPWRDRAPGNKHSVYVRIDWSKNGTYCYASGIGVGNGSASVSCGTGWNGYGQSKSTHIEDSSWWFFKADKPYDQRSDSVRAAVMTCEDHSFSRDPCSGVRVGGISY